LQDGVLLALIKPTITGRMKGFDEGENPEGTPWQSLPALQYLSKAEGLKGTRS